MRQTKAKPYSCRCPIILISNIKIIVSVVYSNTFWFSTYFWSNVLEPLKVLYSLTNLSIKSWKEYLFCNLLLEWTCILSFDHKIKHNQVAGIYYSFTSILLKFRLVKLQYTILSTLRRKGVVMKTEGENVYTMDSENYPLSKNC